MKTNYALHTVILKGTETTHVRIDARTTLSISMYSDGAVEWQERFFTSIVTEGYCKNLSTAQASINRAMRFKSARVVLGKA